MTPALRKKMETFAVAVAIAVVTELGQLDNESLSKALLAADRVVSELAAVMASGAKAEDAL
jgi:hypothetical protein